MGTELLFNQDVGPIREELCVYGDFLTLLGPKAQTNQVSENM